MNLFLASYGHLTLELTSSDEAPVHFDTFPGLLRRLAPGVCLLAILPFADEANAAAFIGGTISSYAGTGACSDPKFVSNGTAQDTFVLNSAAACGGGSASGAIRGDAASASVGLFATSSGNGFGSSGVAGQVAFTDKWLLTVPVGTSVGYFNVPVSLKLDGSVSPGAVDDASFGRFLDYNLTISDLYNPLAPGNSFSALGKITTPGNFALTFDGSVNLYYWGPGSLPTTALVEMSLFLPALFEGTVDFYNTASITLDLPAGYSATTSSGLPLNFASVPVDPPSGVPEPVTLALFSAGLAGAVAMRRRTKKA